MGMYSKDADAKLRNKEHKLRSGWISWYDTFRGLDFTYWEQF